MARADYEVNFYRQIVNSVGKPHKARITTLLIRRCPDARQAGLMAISAFERQWNVYEWRNFANEVEVLVVSHDEGTDAEP